MPIRNQIQSIVQTLAEQPTFIYGTVNELNNLADDVSTFPCVFMYPLQPISVSPHINGSVDNSFSIYLEFLYKTERRRIPAGMVLSKRIQSSSLSHIRPSGQILHLFFSNLIERFIFAASK